MSPEPEQELEPLPEPKCGEIWAITSHPLMILSDGSYAYLSGEILDPKDAFPLTEKLSNSLRQYFRDKITAEIVELLNPTKAEDAE